jgi:hypothetical protein
MSDVNWHLKKAREHAKSGIEAAKRAKERLTCNQQDRDVPKMKCGYPLPCPYHTIVIEQDDLFDGVLKDDNQDG